MHRREMSNIPPWFAGHRNPSLMMMGPEYARQKLAEAEAELKRVTPVTVGKREKGESLEDYQARRDAAKNTGFPALVASTASQVALYKWAVAEHDKVPENLRDQYPVRMTHTVYRAPMKLSGESNEDFETRIAALPDGGWTSGECESWRAP